MSDADIEAAWADVYANAPAGWHVGRPMELPERNEWAMFALDPCLIERLS